MIGATYDARQNIRQPHHDNVDEIEERQSANHTYDFIYLPLIGNLLVLLLVFL